MKVQVFILLGFMCYSAFSQCAAVSTNSITIAGNSYKLGADPAAAAAGCCLYDVTGTGTNSKIIGTGTTGGTCVPKGFFQIGTEVWFVAEIVAAATPFAPTGTGYVEIAPATRTVKTIAIGQLDTSSATNVGKTLKGSMIGALPSTGSTAWAEIASAATGTVAACTSPVATLLSIPVTVAASNFAVDQNKVPNTDMAAGSTTFLGYDTATGRFRGHSSDPCTPTFSKVQSVTVDNVEYQVGARGNECCVQTGTTLFCYNDANLPGTCTALDIAADTASKEVYVALKVTSKGDIATTQTTSVVGNGVSSVDYAKSLIAASALSIDTVFVGRITTTAGADFGKFTFGSYVAPKASGGTYTTFTFTDLRACTSNSKKYVQIEGDLGTSTWTDETGTTIAAATGKGAFLVITPADGDMQGLPSSGRICAGASILSIASAILAFVGLVAL